MKNTVSAIICFAALLFFPGCKNGPTFEIKDTIGDSNRLRSELMIKRGDQLVMIAGCRDCHSPKERTNKGLLEIDGLKFSGYPAKRNVIPVVNVLIQQGWIMYNYDRTMAIGPWGVAFASNLTPDSSGIGLWTEENFRMAIKEGRYKGIRESRLLLSPMPWQNFSNMTDDDLDAIFAYLKRLPPVPNNVPQPIAFENAQPLDTAN